MAKENKPQADPEPVAQIDRIGTETIEIPIRGTAPLVVHRFSEKAKLEMLANAQSKKVA